MRDTTVALLLAVDSLMTLVLMLTIAELVLAAGYVTNTPPPATRLA